MYLLIAISCYVLFLLHYFFILLFNDFKQSFYLFYHFYCYSYSLFVCLFVVCSLTALSVRISPQWSFQVKCRLMMRWKHLNEPAHQASSLPLCSVKQCMFVCVCVCVCVCAAVCDVCIVVICCPAALSSGSLSEQIPIFLPSGLLQSQNYWFAPLPKTMDGE